MLLNAGRAAERESGARCRRWSTLRSVDLRAELSRSAAQSLPRRANAAVQAFAARHPGRPGDRKSDAHRLEEDGARGPAPLSSFRRVRGAGARSRRLVRIAIRHARREGWIDGKSPIALIGDHPNDIRAARANGFARLPSPPASSARKSWRRTRRMFWSRTCARFRWRCCSGQLK